MHVMSFKPIILFKRPTFSGSSTPKPKLYDAENPATETVGTTQNATPFDDAMQRACERFLHEKSLVMGDYMDFSNRPSTPSLMSDRESKNGLSVTKFWSVIKQPFGDNVWVRKPYGLELALDNDHAFRRDQDRRSKNALDDADFHTPQSVPKDVLWRYQYASSTPAKVWVRPIAEYQKMILARLQKKETTSDKAS